MTKWKGGGVGHRADRGGCTVSAARVNFGDSLSRPANSRRSTAGSGATTGGGLAGAGAWAGAGGVIENIGFESAHRGTGVDAERRAFGGQLRDHMIARELPGRAIEGFQVTTSR